jgi:hypothetical protein
MAATAHTLARLVYHLRAHRTPFRDLSAAAYERRTRDRNIAVWRKKSYQTRLHAGGVAGVSHGCLKFLSWFVVIGHFVRIFLKGIMPSEGKPSGCNGRWFAGFRRVQPIGLTCARRAKRAWGGRLAGR